MAIAFRSASVNALVGTDNTPAEPTGAAENDIFVAIMVGAAALTLGLPSGWSSLYAGSGSVMEFLVGWIRRGASAPSLTFTTVGSNYSEVRIAAFSGCLTSGSVIDSQSASGGTGTATPGYPDPPSTTAVGSACMAVCGGGRWNDFGTSITAPTGYTAVVNNNDAQALAYKLLSGSGAEDPSAFGGSKADASGDTWHGFTITLSPVASGVVSPTSFMLLGVQ